MNNKFDELAKGMAQSVTRRQALKKFSFGLAGMALACFGLPNVAKAGKGSCLQSGAKCTSSSQCCSGYCAQKSDYDYGKGTSGNGKGGPGGGAFKCA